MGVREAWKVAVIKMLIRKSIFRNHPERQRETAPKSQKWSGTSFLSVFHCFRLDPSNNQSILPDGVSKVLSGDTHGCSGHAEQSWGSIVELEHPVVNVNLIEFEPAGKIVDKMSHDGVFSIFFFGNILMPMMKLYNCPMVMTHWREIIGQNEFTPQLPLKENCKTFRRLQLAGKRIISDLSFLTSSTDIVLCCPH